MGSDKQLELPVRYCWCDLETSDLGAPHLISPVEIVLKVQEPDGSEDSLRQLVQLLPGDIMSPGATETHGYSQEDTKDFMDPRFAIVELKRFLRQKVNRFDPQDKLLFSGYNAFFDYTTLRAWFERQGVEFFGAFFWWPPFDVMTWAAKKLAPFRHNIPDFKLSTLAAFLGAQVDDKLLHGASYDIELTQFIHRTLEGADHERISSLVRQGNRISRKAAS